MAGFINLASLSCSVSIYLLIDIYDLNLSLSLLLLSLSCLVPSGVAGHNARVSCSSTTRGTMDRRLTHCVAFRFRKVVT